MNTGCRRLALMRLESVLARCQGCEIHGLLVRGGKVRKDQAYQARAVTSRQTR